MVDDPALSSYLYAISFDRCPEKDIASYQNFDKKLLNRAISNKNPFFLTTSYFFSSKENSLPGRPLSRAGTISSNSFKIPKLRIFFLKFLRSMSLSRMVA